MRYGFVIDQNRCIGCHACTVACKEEHSVPVGSFRTWVKYIEKGEFPATSRHFGVMRCNHCDHAPCIEICPTVSLYRRPDGIVDFDSDRCIGCKSCMQACPYDALYIDADTHTAAKCNYCAHRVELNLEPACVIVCPTQAIISGDLDDATSNISRIVATQKVSARKPHKGTEPKLFYVGIDGDLLEPTAPAHQDSHFWSDKQVGEDAYKFPDAEVARAGADASRVVYDVAHPAPWGWKIVAYLWTKSVGAGVLIVAAILLALGIAPAGTLLGVASPILAMIFTAATAALLIFDLKRPDRFYYLLTKPNLRSWVVLGAYILIAYSGFSFLWLLNYLILGPPDYYIVYPTAALAIGSACYSAFLFAQAKGRDLWQSPIFLWHLFFQAVAAGASTLLVANALIGSESAIAPTLAKFLLAAVLASLATTLGEIFLSPHGREVQLAIALMTRGALRRPFWLGAVGGGLILPAILLILAFAAVAPDTLNILAAVAALIGVWAFESIWVKAGQAVPLS
jgi:Fe-S-cluster-containing dehydrogenase component/formate-dependent nitrite reductase membrane component NrfD